MPHDHIGEVSGNAAIKKNYIGVLVIAKKSQCDNLKVQTSSGSEKNRFLLLQYCEERCCLGPLAPDTSGQLYVLRHDGDSLGVDGAEVRVFEETDQVSLARFLESHHGRTLETEVGLEILSDLSDETLERQLSDEQFGALLVASDFSQGHSSGPVTVRFLHTTGGRCALARRLGSQLLPGCLTTG